MSTIIPIRDLKNTSNISNLCHKTNEPIYITKNGYGDMVIMSLKAYDEKMALLDVYEELAKSEEEIKSGKVSDARQSLKKLRAELHV
jgi:PHD/YefM family antitoxin component YafN of YafNO toxin-antitoxin module